MSLRPVLSRLAIAVLLTACQSSTASTVEGPVQIAIQQSLTSQTSAAGTFQLSGAVSDAGSTTEELTFGGPLDRPPVPVTFRRTLVGAHGTMVLSGSASLSFTSPTAGVLAGSWKVEQATGKYASLAGTGTLTGSADFSATPATASIAYSGNVKEQ